MQLLEVVLYNSQGKQRHVGFQPGALNVVTGVSATGKSALLHIVEYCLGRDHLTVPAGVISRTVQWYSVRLLVGEQQVFVARPKPRAGRASSTRAMYIVGRQVAAPSFSELQENTDTTALREQLGRLVGIGEYRVEPAPGSLRHPFAAGLGQAALLCFQGQGEVADQNLLFHRQSDDGVAQALKDTLPYFLGAVAPDHAVKRLELVAARRDVRRLQDELATAQRAVANVDSQVQALVNEAYASGLIAVQSVANRAEALRLLRSAVVRPMSAPAQVDDSEQSRRRRELENQRAPLRQELREVADQRALLLEQEGSEDGFQAAVLGQITRLQALEVIPRRSAEGIDDQACPACGSQLEEPDATVQEMATSLERLRGQLAGVQATRPRREGVLRQLDERVAAAVQRLRAIDEALTELDAADRLALGIVSVQEERAFRRGRIDAILGRLQPGGEEAVARRQAALESAQRAVAELEAELDEEAEREEITSRLNVIGETMRLFASERLALEHSAGLVRLDLNKLTLVVDTAEGPVPLLRVGSAENWVGYHLVAHLALHRYFSNNERPVPRFLMLDQPTQAYYPSDREKETGQFEAEEDRDAVRRLFLLMLEVVQELAPNFQVIVCDHANLDEVWFQRAVGQNNWRDGLKLVPSDWIVEEHGESAE